jgi:hypothetical protein
MNKNVGKLHAGNRSRRLGHLTALSVAVTAAMTVPIVCVPWARADAPLPTFTGSAGGKSLAVTLEGSGFPVTDTPVDVGGPTAQVDLDSIGGSSGYAALPDPGQFVTTLPSLANGLFANGAGGLPPTTLPVTAKYPFFISSNASSGPAQSVGSGPYRLSAESTPTLSRATAVGGFDTGLTGHVSLLTSTASVEPTGSSIVASGTTDIQALSIGPLTFGEIRSVATMTLDAAGQLSKSSSLVISGAELAGQPVNITETGLTASGTQVPVPIGTSLASVLKASNISVRLLDAKASDGAVTAPALTITMPFSTAAKSAGTGSPEGELTMTIGRATASLTGAGANGAGLTAGAQTADPQAGSIAVGQASPPAGTGISAGDPGVGSGNAGVAVGGQGSAASAPSVPLATRPVASDVSLRSAPKVFGVEGLYLWFVVGAALIVVMGWLLRVRGVRRP